MTKLLPDAPAWLQALQKECERTSQAACARRLGVCSASVSQLLSGSYAADTRRMEARVAHTLLGDVRPCPVLGDVTAARCLEEQSAPYFPDPIRSALSKACKACPFARNPKESK